MKKVMLILLIIGASLIVIGMIGGVAALAVMRFDFSGLSTEKEVTETYDIDKDFSSLSFDTIHGLKFVLSDGEACKVVYNGTGRGERSAAVENGTLIISEKDGTPQMFSWYFKESAFTVYLPRTSYHQIEARVTTGDIKLPDAFSFNTAKITSTTGNVVFSAKVSGELTIKTTTGDVTVKDVRPQSFSCETSTGDVTLEKLTVKEDASVLTTTGDISADRLTCRTLRTEVTTGRLNLSSVSCDDLTSSGSTGDVKMTNVTCNQSLAVMRSTGDITMHGCDAPWITLKTTTGDVKGTVLSPKQFNAHATTGHVRVPQSSSSGGVCEVNTTTGDIDISVLTASDIT